MSGRQNEESRERVETVYVALLDEGTTVWRAVIATPCGNGNFRLGGSPDADEKWEFPPGTVVRCEERTFASGEVGLAVVRRAPGEQGS